MDTLWQTTGLSSVLVATAPGGIVVVDAAGRFQLFNPMCERLFGYTSAEIAGRNLAEIFANPPPLAELLRPRDAGGLPLELTGRRKDGSLFPLRLSMGEGALGDQTIYVGLILDNTAQKDVENTLREREEKLSSVFETGPDAIIIFNEQGAIESLNAAAVWLFGYLESEVLGQDVKMLMPALHHERHDGFQSNHLNTGEKRIIGIARVIMGQRRGGEMFPMELNVGEIRIGARRLFTGFIRDITERQGAERRLKELQGELLHVSRLTDMGQMSSALAHELNQPLTAIANYTKAARRTLDQGIEASRDKVQDLLDKAAGQALRAGQIIRRLRDFIEKREDNRAPEDVNSIIEEAMALAFVGTAGASATISTKLGAHLPKVLIDKIQVQQVVLNLARNAFEAMAGSPRRELCVSTAQENDDFVQVTVADTGPGLPEEVAAKLFQPFVTTKPDGMGIGLSICRSIVDAHGGKLWATSSPGDGVTFRFQLPIAHGGDEEKATT